MINDKSKEAYRKIQASERLKQRVYNIDTSVNKSYSYLLKPLVFACVLLLVIGVSLNTSQHDDVTLYINNEIMNDSLIVSNNTRSISMASDSVEIECAIDTMSKVDISVSEGFIIIDENNYEVYSTTDSLNFIWQLHYEEVQNTPKLYIVYNNEQYIYTVHQNIDFEWVIERGN